MRAARIAARISTGEYASYLTHVEEEARAISDELFSLGHDNHEVASLTRKADGKTVWEVYLVRD